MSFLEVNQFQCFSQCFTEWPTRYKLGETSASLVLPHFAHRQKENADDLLMIRVQPRQRAGMKCQLCHTNIPVCALACWSRIHPADSDLIKMHWGEQLWFSSKMVKLEQREMKKRADEKWMKVFLPTRQCEQSFYAGCGALIERKKELLHFTKYKESRSIWHSESWQIITENDFLYFLYYVNHFSFPSLQLRRKWDSHGIFFLLLPPYSFTKKSQMNMFLPSRNHASFM